MQACASKVDKHSPNFFLSCITLLSLRSLYHIWVLHFFHCIKVEMVLKAEFSKTVATAECLIVRQLSILYHFILTVCIPKRDNYMAGTVWQNALIKPCKATVIPQHGYNFASRYRILKKFQKAKFIDSMTE